MFNHLSSSLLYLSIYKRYFKLYYGLGNLQERSGLLWIVEVHKCQDYVH
jgi:hypothetical protein